MKILFAVENNAGLDSKLDNRFGRAGYFVIVEMEDESVVSVEENKYKNEGHGVGIKTGTYVVESGCQVAVGAQPGPKAAQILDQAGIKMIIDTQGTVKEAFERIRGNI